MSDDHINSLLSEGADSEQAHEFHTKNGIPTNPVTHNLFYVSRVRFATVLLLGGVGAAAAGYVVGAANGHGSTLQVVIYFVGLGLCFLPNLIFDMLGK